ncbi:hypothetical protein, partial [Croceitalea sp. MTPC5]|uniref:hypothetical protein n=1 Tax=Croceitalea sp. MTPC5 TaxID=3056565 RepID=UPI0030D436DD
DANNALDVRTNGIYATDTDDQTAGEVAVADAGDNFTTDTVEAALAELAGRTDNDTQYTAGNGLNLDGSNEFTAVASPDANNALDVRANGIYATDDQNAGEVTVADAGDNFTVDTVEAALAELAGRTDNDTQYTAGNGLNLDGSNEFTAVASPDANNALDVRANGIYATDDQEGTEVNLTAPIDIDGDTTIDYTTVEQVIQDVAPVIPAIKAARVFYPPSIAIDASANGTFTINLYAQYIAQFGSPVASSGGTIPVYADDELDYHVTFADPSVFGAMSISTTGELTYTIVGQPADYNSLINVVFVVK